ncbi:Uncharacterised protein [Enterococcus gallinarum]|nr:Uncharacterised protein [Enterococcus gallinarum]
MWATQEVIYTHIKPVAIDNTETWIDSGKEFKITQDGWIKLSDKQKLRPFLILKYYWSFRG